MMRLRVQTTPTWTRWFGFAAVLAAFIVGGEIGSAPGGLLAAFIAHIAGEVVQGARVVRFAGDELEVRGGLMGIDVKYRARLEEISLETETCRLRTKHGSLFLRPRQFRAFTRHLPTR